MNIKKIIIAFLLFIPSIVAFLLIPLLSLFGIDVFALRGILIIIYFPILIISIIPFAYYLSKNIKPRNNKK